MDHSRNRTVPRLGVRARKMRLSGSHFAGFCKFVEFMPDFSDIRPCSRLIIAKMGHVVPDVEVFFIADRTGKIPHLIHPVPVPVDIFSFVGICSKKWSALHVGWNGVPVRLRTVGPKSTKETNSRFFSPGCNGARCCHFLGKRIERNMHAAVEQARFVPGHTRSVIRKEENNGIFSQSILLQLLEDFSTSRSIAVRSHGNGPRFFEQWAYQGSRGVFLFRGDDEFDPL